MNSLSIISRSLKSNDFFHTSKILFAIYCFIVAKQIDEIFCNFHALTMSAGSDSSTIWLGVTVYSSSNVILSVLDNNAYKFET